MKILAIAVLIALAIFLVLFVTLIGRRRLAQRTTTVVPVPPSAPSHAPSGDQPGDQLSDQPGASTGPGPVRFGPVEAVYVSTTLHGDWLARVGAHGLGDRAHAVVSVHDAGVLVERDGTDDLWLPVSTIRTAGLAPGMAGKYVGTDGLVVLSWAVPAADGVPEAMVDTGLRTRQAQDRGALVDAVHHLLADQRGPQQAQHSQQAQHIEQAQHSQQAQHQQEAR